MSLAECQWSHGIPWTWWERSSTRLSYGKFSWNSTKPRLKIILQRGGLVAGLALLCPKSTQTSSHMAVSLLLPLAGPPLWVSSPEWAEWQRSRGTWCLGSWWTQTAPCRSCWCRLCCWPEDWWLSCCLRPDRRSSPDAPTFRVELRTFSLTWCLREQTGVTLPSRLLSVWILCLYGASFKMPAGGTRHLARIIIQECEWEEKEMHICSCGLVRILIPQDMSINLQRYLKNKGSVEKLQNLKRD